MKKVLGTDLEAKIGGIIEEGEDAPSKIIQLLRDLQDSSGVKICTAVTETDPAYKEVK